MSLFTESGFNKGQTVHVRVYVCVWGGATRSLKRSAVLHSIRLSPAHNHIQLKGQTPMEL